MRRTTFASKDDASGAIIERRKRILCADDHEDTRTMMMALLGLYGYQVTTTDSLTDALSLTKKGGFDLLILDGWYPDGLGVDLCKQLRTFDTHTPVLFVSALAYATDIANGMNAGAQAYLTKPVDACLLEETIAELICSDKLPLRFSGSL
jgi:DNA-binding response OmpR family regulator